MKHPEINDWVKKQTFDAMLQTLSKEISQKYGITIEEAKNILEKKTSLSLNEFREELDWQKWWKNMNENDLEELYSIVEGYKKILIEKSKFGIETLKALLSKETLPFETSTHTWLKEKFPDIMKRIENPKNISDQVTGWIIWIVESGLTILTICYLIGKGIIKAPYDIYLISTWKATYDTWKRI
jgi:DNA-directed RNA polymerase subunit F